MFAPKQKAVSLPTRTQLNNLWLEARKKIGNNARLPLNPGAKGRAIHLTVQCYRSCTQPTWQLELAAADGPKTIASSDLVEVSQWISDSLAASNVIALSTKRQTENYKETSSEWLEVIPPCETLLPITPVGTSELPVDTIDGATDSISESATLAGDLCQINGASLLQSLALAMVSGTLRIISHISGSVEWHKGEIIEALWGSLRGRDAICEIAQLSNGRFTLHNSISQEATIRAADKTALMLSPILIDAARKEDQTRLLDTRKLDELAMTLMGGKLAKAEAGESQWTIASKFVRHGGRKQIVFAMQILKFLREGQQSLHDLKLQTGLSDYEIKTTAKVFLRTGLVELYSIKGNSQPAADTGKQPLLSLQTEDEMELIDSANCHLQSIIDAGSKTSFILVRGALSAGVRRLKKTIKSLMRREDHVYIVEEEQLLVVMKEAGAQEAAQFVRRLRQAGIKESAADKSGGQMLYLTAVVSAPEDGTTVSGLIDKACLALEITKTAV